MTAPLPLPATVEAWANGCTCGQLRQNPDCPLHSESARERAKVERVEDRERDPQPVRLPGSAT